MPNECSYCGERKLCRKEYTELSLLNFFNWICKDCDKVRVIIRNEERIAELKKQRQRQANWIKVRDKILKQHGKELSYDV